ncbi:hypothetical protein Tco_0008746 [Tanacetum coccineum]
MFAHCTALENACCKAHFAYTMHLSLQHHKDHASLVLSLVYNLWDPTQDQIVTTSRYVVPTGRVTVPAGSVVPIGKDNVIVSTGRTKFFLLVEQKLFLVVLCLLRVDRIVS